MAQDNQAKRNLLIGLGAVGVFLVVGYVLFTWIFSSNPDAGANSSVSHVNASSTGGRQSAESEYYSSLLQNYNQENAQQAQNTGSSYLSVLSQRDEQQVEPEPEPAPEPVQPVYYPPPPPQPQPQPQSQPRQVSDALVNNVQGMMASWAPRPSQQANTVEWPQEEVSHVRNNPQGGEGGQGQAQAAGGAGGSALDHRILPDYAVLSAILDTEIDTDENSLVIAEVPAGPYAGARFYASGYRRLENTVDLTFTAMRWNGRSYAVNAKPIDVDTNRTALSGEVSSRYWTRIGIPAVARGIARAGQLYEDASRVTVVSGLGTVVSGSDGRVNDREVAGAFVGGLAGQTANVLEQDASRIPIKQVLVPRHTTIGIQVIGSVKASDELDPGVQALDLDASGQVAPQPQREQTFQPMGQQPRPSSGTGTIIVPELEGVQ